MIGKGNREKSTKEEEEELWAGEVLEEVADDVINEMAEAEEVVVVVDAEEVEDKEVDSLLLELLLLFPEVTLLALLDEDEADRSEATL